jgi:hypothetical protein
VEAIASTIQTMMIAAMSMASFYPAAAPRTREAGLVTLSWPTGAADRHGGPQAGGCCLPC